MINSSENKRHVTVEELLRLKRAERPSPEFWAKFESELRAKQLAAIIEKRSWWKGFTIAAVIRRRVPIGATAALVVAVISVAEYRSISARQRATATVVDVAVGSSEAVNSLTVNDLGGIAEGSFLGAVSHPPADLPTEISADDLAAARQHKGDSLASVTALGSSNESSRSSQGMSAAGQPGSGDLSPVARSIANNLAAAKEAHPELTDRFFGVNGFEKRSLPANRQAIDPLAQMRTPSELHRERLLASVTSTPSANASRNNERVVRRISDQRLTEEAISRFDARGNVFSLKF